MNTKLSHLVKTCLCLFGLLTPYASLTTNGQETYKPMLKDGRVWNCIEVYFGAEKNDTVNREYRIEETSELDGHVCYNLCLGNKQIGIYYEEGPKVFRHTANGWELLLDFSLSPGDVAPKLGGLMVDEVKTIVIKGEPRRCLYFPVTTDYGTQLCWIEGIGSSLSGPYYYDEFIGSLLSVKLQSVYDGDVCIFEDDDLGTDEEPHQPLPFLEGNPIWVYKYEHIPRLRDPNIICWIDTGDRVYTYYFLGRQKEIEGKVYTMMGEVECSREGEITLNRWYPVREENGIVYTITDSLPRVVEFGYDDVPYLEQGNECVLYNFSAEIGGTLYKNHVVKSFDTYQLIDGTVCRVLKTNGLPLYEKLGYRDDDGTYGVIDPLWGIAIATNGHAYTKCLNAYYQDDTMLYKAPDAPEGLCVNDTIWTTLDDTYIYARSYKADPYHDDVMAYIRQLQTTTEGSVTIGGLNYFLYLDRNEAVLTGGNNCSGEVDIPSEVNYNEETFVVKSMVYNTFYYNSELTKVKIPKSIESIRHSYPYDPNDEDAPTGMVSSDYMNPFKGCTALESIEVDEENPSFKSVDGVLFSKDGTRLYCYPAGAQRESYTIPDGVEWIGTGAFEHNQYISTLTIPNSLKQICNYIFADCSNLKDVYCYAEDVPVTFSNAFKDFLIASATLHVPAGSIDLYKTTSPWSEFGNIVEIPLVTFTKGQVATIILPITPDADKGRYFRLDRWEDDKIILEEEPQPQARTPYVIIPNEDFSINLNTLDVTGLRFDTVRIEAVSPLHPPRMAEIRFVGTYSKRNIGYKDNGFHLIILDTTSDCYYLEGGSIVMSPLHAHFEVKIDFYYYWRPWNKLVYELHSTDGTIVTTEDPVTFTEGQMATIILPTEPDASKGKYYSLDKCEDDQIIFEQELQPQARTPYVIIPNEDFSIDPSTMDLEGLSHDAVSIEGISFIGSYSHEEFSYQEGFYIDIIDTTPDCLDDWFGSGKAIVGPLRAYLQVNWDDPYTQGGTKDPQKVMEIVLHNHGTGINEIQDSKLKIQNESVIFDLQGRRIDNSKFNIQNSKLSKGVYIFNGKKRMVK